MFHVSRYCPHPKQGSRKRRGDDKGQKEDRMWHLPPIQKGRPEQLMNALQNEFKGERAECWIEEMSSRDQGTQGPYVQALR